MRFTISIKCIYGLQVQDNSTRKKHVQKLIEIGQLANIKCLILRRSPFQNTREELIQAMIKRKHFHFICQSIRMYKIVHTLHICKILYIRLVLLLL